MDGEKNSAKRPRRAAAAAASNTWTRAIKEEKDVVDEEAIVQSTSKTPKTPDSEEKKSGRARLGFRNSLKVDDFQHDPYLFNDLSHRSRQDFVKFFIRERKAMTCPKCKFASADVDAAVEHLGACLSPEARYFAYKDNMDKFHKLNDRELKRLIRGCIGQSGSIKCLTCDKVITTTYGAEYHLTRCGKAAAARSWRCYQCGYQSTVELARQHLQNECIKNVTEADIEICKQEISSDSESDIKNTRRSKGSRKSDKGVVKRERDPDFHPTATAEISIRGSKEIKKFLDDFKDQKKLDQVGRLLKSRYQASVSSGLIPGKSSRVSILKGGTLRFKFRKLEVTETVPNKIDLQRYERVIWESQKRFDEEISVQEFCDGIKEILPADWKRIGATDYITALKDKSSVGLRPWNPSNAGGSPAKENNSNSAAAGTIVYDLPVTELPTDLKTLKFAESTTISNKAISEKSNPLINWATVAYAGGPINSIDFAPNQRSDGSDVFALSTFCDDATLTGAGRDWTSRDGYVQLWTIQKEPGGHPTTKVWCVLRIPGEGLVLKLKWCSKPCVLPKNDADPVGYLAVAMSSGKVLIYRIDNKPFDEKKEEIPFFEVKPAFVLIQEKNYDYESGDEPLGYPSIISLDWAYFDGGDRVAAVNAAGNILIWELSNKEFFADEGILATELSSEAWNSPAVDVVLSSEKAVAVSFREGLLRLLDTETGECLLEEATIRTAGQRAAAQTRLFPGIFLFQVLSNDSTAGGVCYLVPDRENKGYFIVPLSNKHDLCVWDVSISPTRGLVNSCGVDGAVLISVNGRLAPLKSVLDFTFSAQRKALQLTRSRINLKPPADEVAPPIHDTHELAKKYMWLDINVEDCDKVPARRNLQSCGDLRLESLNAISTNYKEDSLVVTGGQAGLLFILPCRL